MQFPTLFNPLLSFTQTMSLKLASIYPRFGEVDTVHQMNLGPHPMAALYQATDETYKQLKQAVKEISPLEHASLKRIKQNESLRRLGKIEKTKEAIHRLVLDKLGALSQIEKNQLYGKVYKLTRPSTDDPQWGEHHALDNIPLLIDSMYSCGFISCSQTTKITLWEKERSLTNKSHYFSLEQRRELGVGEIGYINGIGTSFDQARWDAYRFSDDLAASHNIHCVYSATHGYATDLYISLQAQSGISSEPVLLLLEQWDDFFQRSKSTEERYLQLCMSQGAIMVNLALSLLPPHLRERICVIAIAPGCFIPTNEASQIIHIIKKEDTVPNALALNRELISSGNPSIIVVPNDQGHHPHDPHGPSYVAVARRYVQHYFEHNRII